MTHWRAFLAVSATVAVGIYTGNFWFAFTAGALTALAVWWRYIRDQLAGVQSGNRWWAHPTLVKAFVDAGILPTLRGDDPPHKLLFTGKPQTNDAGTTIIAVLPPGIPYTAATNRHAQLASAMHVPLNKLDLSHLTEDSGGAVRIWVGAKTKHTNVKHIRSHLATTDRTNWRDPLRIGFDNRHRPVMLGTDEHNTLVAGMMGYGKTTLVRLPIGHYILDPDTLIFGADGKGNRSDYGRVASIAQQWVWGNSPDPAGECATMFKELIRMVQARNAEADTNPNPPGVLLILEEFQEIRESAPDIKSRKELDSLLGRVLRMGRSVAFHTIVSTQRPSNEDFATGQRNIVDQRIALKVQRREDAKLVLGHTPDLALPDRRGEAIIALPTGDSHVSVDYLDNNDWKAICDRAVKLRTGTPAAAEIEPAIPSPLLTAVLSVLESNPEGVSASTILTQLPEDVRPVNASALGQALSRYPQVVSVRSFDRGRLWQLRVAGSPASVDRAENTVN